MLGCQIPPLLIKYKRFFLSSFKTRDKCQCLAYYLLIKVKGFNPETSAQAHLLLLYNYSGDR